jgi:hypothetical protein
LFARPHGAKLKAALAGGVEQRIEQLVSRLDTRRVERAEQRA